MKMWIVIVNTSLPFPCQTESNFLRSRLRLVKNKMFLHVYLYNSPKIFQINTIIIHFSMYVNYFLNDGINGFFFSENGQRVTGLADIRILYTPLLVNVLYLRPKPVLGEGDPPPPH